MSDPFGHWLHLPNLTAPTAATIPEQTPYPIEALPRIIRDAVLEVHLNDRIPVAALAPFAIGVAGLFPQGWADVQGLEGKKISLALYLAITTDSGDDRIAIVNRFTSSLKAIDEASYLEDEKAKIEFKAKLRIWKGEGKAFDKKVSKLKVDGKCTEHLQAEIEEHERREPVAPRPSRIIFDDITGRAFIDALQGDGQIAAVIADESAQLMKNRLFRQLVNLNNTLDGSMVRLEGAGGGGVVTRNARVSIILMIQRSVRDAYLSEHINGPHGANNMAPYLFADPSSMKKGGTMTDKVPLWLALDCFHDRVNAMNAKRSSMTSEGVNNRIVVELDDDALELLLDFRNAVEERIKPGGALNDIVGFASQAPGNACRMAAVFHCFTEQQGKLTRDMLQRAITIMMWHIVQAKREFGTPPPVPQAIHDAEDVDAWTTLKYWSKGYRIVERKWVRKNVTPTYLRNDARLDAALAILAEQKRIRVTRRPRRQCDIELRTGFS